MGPRPRGSADELEAAAALCRSAGYWAVPYPVAERLARPPDLDVDGLVVVADRRPGRPWPGSTCAGLAVDLDGRRSRATGTAAAGAAAEVGVRRPRSTWSRSDDDGDRPTSRSALVLPCWTLLGMLDRAMDLTRAYVLDRAAVRPAARVVPGRPVPAHRRRGRAQRLEELARYALWSIEAGRPEALDDALALRLAAIEAADVVFRDHPPAPRRHRVLRRDDPVVAVARTASRCAACRSGWPPPGTADPARPPRPDRAVSPNGCAMSDLEEFRDQVRDWCRATSPPTGAPRRPASSDEEFVAFQQAWFPELRAAGFAVPHWPAEWGGGMSTAEQVVLYQELAAHDAPRLVLAFVVDPPRRLDAARRRHRGAAAAAPARDPRRRDLVPGLLRARRRLGPGQPARPPPAATATATWSTARRCGPAARMHADWCLLLARTDPDAPKRQGISYFLMDMRTPGIDVRPIRQATGESHFCEMFLDDVLIPAANLVGAGERRLAGGPGDAGAPSGA